MIQPFTMVDVADNSGVKVAMCIRVKRGTSAKGQFTRSMASVGDVIWVAIKKSLPTCQLDDKKVHKCVVIRTKKAIRRPDGSYVRFDSNAAVMVDNACRLDAQEGITAFLGKRRPRWTGE